VPRNQDAAARIEPADGEEGADWQRRVVGRSLHDAKRRSIDRGARLIRAAATVLERTNGASLTVQEVADEAGQSLRTLYQYFESKDDLLLAVYEEAMRTYARIVRAAIDEFDDPVERLAAALIASVRMPALHHMAGLDRGLSRLRLHLGQAEPALVARSQAPVTSLFRDLVAEALEATLSTDVGFGLGVEAATYVLSSLRTATILSSTLGNDIAVDPPDVIELSCFCLSGIGVPRPRPWHEDVDARLRLAGPDGRSILRRLANAPAGACPPSKAR
jgi:AcrR family transcriptional regulator